MRYNVMVTAREYSQACCQRKAYDRSEIATVSGEASYFV